MKYVKHLDFETLAAQATGSVFAFADFTHRIEHLFDESGNAVALQAYRSAWFELEIVNATALDAWEADGRPRTWDAQWKEQFMNDAAETVGMVRAAAQRFLE